MPTHRDAPPGSWFDTHAHLYLLAEESPRDAMLRRAEEAVRAANAAGVCGILCPGIDTPSNEAAIELARRCPGTVWAAVGVHPNSAAECGDEDWERVAHWVADPAVKAIGETGLDRYRDYTPWDVQCDWFRRHLDLAVRSDLPAVVHCRDAEEEITPLLREYAGRGLRGVVHACAAVWDHVQTWLELGLYISFAGSVTYRNRKFEVLRETARRVPPDRILVETDAPFLTPEPLRGRVPQCRVEYVAHTGAFLAALREMAVEEFAAQTRRNACALFGLSP
ncbi:MAG: TatD family hydrolase [Thermogutta sp.]|nr:TatD family hydrolase [Thermogutta sp.]